MKFDWIKTNKKESIYSALTIVNLLLVLITINATYDVFNKQQKINEENQKIILENLKSEINVNLKIISAFNEGKENFKNTNEFILIDLEYYYLEKSQNIIKDHGIREFVINTTKNIKTVNNKLSLFTKNLFLPITEEQKQIYRKLKVEYVDTIVNENNIINADLNAIRQYLDRYEH